MEHTLKDRYGLPGGGVSPVRRIASAVICSDPLMTSGREQWSNLRWMRDLLSRPVAEPTGLPVRALSSGETEGDAFSRRRFFELAGIELDGGAVQFWYDDAAVPAAALEYLEASGLDPSTLVIGYELSPQTKRILDRIGALYVDIWLHPVRFYEDTLFAFQSNDPEVDAALAPFHVPDGQLSLYADRLRVQAYKGWRRREAEIVPGSAAFFGQTPNDKSVCRDGRMLGLTDFLDAFDSLGARTQDRGGEVLYQRHPFVKKGDEAALAAVEARPWARLSQIPTYDALASPDLAEVMTISSSVAQEARYFDKPATVLFRPMIRFDEPAAPDQFHTICQDFVSPHFWAAILAPVMRVREVEPVRFLDPKDKIRDMLGFYWSWRQIDKTEAMRAELEETKRAAARTALAGTAPAPAKPAVPAPDFRGFANTLRGMADLKQHIDSAGIVSFDVFETLLERAIEKPEHLLFFMGRQVHETLDSAIPNFVQARREARGWAVARGDVIGEEVPLAARYRAIAYRFALSEDQGRWLLEHELDWERRLMRARACGREVFDHAKAAGKRIVLVSDTYFDRDFVEEMLAACGFEGWDALYLSSETGVLKRTGGMFRHLLEAEGVAPEEILHVGDNLRIDVERGREAGLRAYHMRSTPVVARRISPLLKAYDGIDDIRAASAVKGLVARHVAGPVKRGAPGFSQGSAFTLGYAVLGPMFFGFANWVRSRAKRDGVRDLLFLSRDGDIVRRCYQALASLDPDAPRGRYLLASRRALGVATLRGPKDLAERAGVNFSPCAMDDLMRHRFGVPLDAIPDTARARHGFGDAAPWLDWGADRDRFMRFVSDPDAAEVLLANAREEADALGAWYAEQGVDRETARQAAVVDIGHMGTLQKGLRDFLRAPELRGYYFVTFDEIVGVMPDAGRATAGWLASRLRSADSDYKRHLQMYETAFLNDAGSFMRIRRECGTLRPETVQAEGEAARRAFARNCHDGVAAFCEEMAAAFGEAALKFRLEADEARAAWAMMLDHPFPLDARLFEGVGFENLYSGRGVKYILPPPGAPRDEAIWKEGLRHLPEPAPEAAGTAARAAPLRGILRAVRTLAPLRRAAGGRR